MHCLCVKGFPLFGSFQMPCTWGKCHWINFVVLFYELSLSCGCWYVGCKIIHASSLCEKLLKGIDVHVSRRPLFAGKLAAIVVIVKDCPYPPARIFLGFWIFHRCHCAAGSSRQFAKEKWLLVNHLLPPDLMLEALPFFQISDFQCEIFSVRSFLKSRKNDALYSGQIIL